MLFDILISLIALAGRALSQRPGSSYCARRAMGRGSVSRSGVAVPDPWSVALAVADAHGCIRRRRSGELSVNRPESRSKEAIRSFARCRGPDRRAERVRLFVAGAAPERSWAR